MADSSPATPPSVTPEEFFAERQSFWNWWSNFVTVTVIGVAVLLILLAWFLL